MHDQPRADVSVGIATLEIKVDEDGVKEYQNFLDRLTKTKEALCKEVTEDKEWIVGDIQSSCWTLRNLFYFAHKRSLWVQPSNFTDFEAQNPNPSYKMF